MKEQVVIAWLFVLIISVLAALGGPLLPWKDWMAQENLAEWAQAVSALIAIVAGAAAISWQVRRQHAQQRQVATEEEVRKLKLLASVAFHLRYSARVVERAVEQHQVWIAHGTMLEMEQRIETLREHRLFDYPTAEVHFGVAELIHLFHRLNTDLKASGQGAIVSMVSLRLGIKKEFMPVVQGLERGIERELRLRSSATPEWMTQVGQVIFYSVAFPIQELDVANNPPAADA